MPVYPVVNGVRCSPLSSLVGHLGPGIEPMLKSHPFPEWGRANEGAGFISNRLCVLPKGKQFGGRNKSFTAKSDIHDDAVLTWRGRRQNGCAKARLLDWGRNNAQTRAIRQRRHQC